MQKDFRLMTPVGTLPVTIYTLDVGVCGGWCGWYGLNNGPRLCNTCGWQSAIRGGISGCPQLLLTTLDGGLPGAPLSLLLLRRSESIKNSQAQVPRGAHSPGQMRIIPSQMSSFASFNGHSTQF